MLFTYDVPCYTICVSCDDSEDASKYAIQKVKELFPKYSWGTIIRDIKRGADDMDEHVIAVEWD